MAGRYSKEYRPNEFVKLPFEEVAKVMAMKEQQYQQGYLQPAAYQQKMGELEVRTPDIEYHQKLINDATSKARQLAEETYGGDYGAAASDITRTLANEASNPFYSWTKSKMDEYKKAKDIEMKLKAEGKYIGFDEGLLNTAYYDKENNKYNTNLTTNLQEKLDYEKQRQDIWNYAIQEEGGSYKGKLANAETEAKAGRLFLEIPKTSWQGVNDTQITNKFKGALAQYMSTAEYDQEKALLKKNGLDDKQADIKIADDMLKSGLLKKHMITKDDSQILNNPLSKADGDGTKKTPYDDLDPKELPVNLDSDEIKEKINKVKQSGDSRKKIIREYLGTQIVSKWKKFEKDYGLSISNVNDKVNLLKKTLRDIESRPQAYGDIVNSKRKATEELNKYLDLQNKSKKYQGFDMSEADSVLKNNPSFQLLKSKYKTIYDKSKLAGESIDNFVDKVTALEQKAIIEPHNQYYTTNEGFNTGIDNDLRRANSVKTDEDIVNSDTGEKINYNRLIAKMDEGGSDGQKSAPYKFSVTDNGIVMHKGIESFVIPSKYFLPKTRYALNTAEKVLEQYKLYDNATEDYASPQVVSLNDIGRKIIVFPGKGYKWLKGNNVTVSEGKDAITNGILQIEQLVDDVMNVVSNNYKK